MHSQKRSRGSTALCQRTSNTSVHPAEAAAKTYLVALVVVITMPYVSTISEPRLS
jgi:hypothetical protein